MKKSKVILKNIIIYLSISAIIIGLFSAVFISTKSDSISVNAPISKSDSGVMLTFNVYQGTDEVNKIIDILNEYGVSATFFIGGCWAVKNTETLLRIKNNNFKIGSHGYYHYDHSKLNYKQNYDEITKSLNAIESIIGEKITLFAPPSGSYNEDCLKVAKDLNLKVIMWSKDTIDWRDQDVELIVSRATKNIKENDIILMHPTKATVLALPKIIEGIIGEGHKIS